MVVPASPRAIGLWSKDLPWDQRPIALCWPWPIPFPALENWAMRFLTRTLLYLNGLVKEAKQP